ncbi:MAG: Inositol-1-monophosphatase [Elusimicrobia bacterium ADurb.Bin231]|nr:MAG: Inositol-1-monophosphatase [Elusimicrobia bacterium ADurb.Bin231]
MKKFLTELSGISGKILIKHFRSKLNIRFKGKTDPVTEADRNSENALKKIISRKFPNDLFICEESCPSPSRIDNDKRYWIIDPLDGTVNYTHGFGTFCVSIAVMLHGEITHGIVYNPYSKEMFYAEKGKGAYKNGKKISVSKTRTIRKSLLVTGFPYYTHKNPKNVFQLFNTFAVTAQGVRRLGSAALDLCYVADGNFEGFWEENLGPWDVAAGSLIVKEAGGNVSDFNNGNNYIFGKHIIASNPYLHKQMFNIINKKISL